MVNILPGFLIKFFARSYVSGNSIEKGVEKADNLWSEKGIYSSLDLLAEAVTTRSGVEFTIDTYITLLNLLKNNKYASVSLKPTSLGIHESYEYCAENLDTILNHAKDCNIPITLDMENHEYTDLTLNLYKDFLDKYSNFGTVLQSRLYRTKNDICQLSDYNSRIRICIGIYNEKKDIALVDKVKMKEKLIEYTTQLINQGSYVEVATHDITTISRVLDLVDEFGWTSNNLEFQQLLGVPMKSMQDKLIQLGFKVRLYVPFATDWTYAIPYLKRRLANNPSMAFYVLKHSILRRS